MTKQKTDILENNLGSLRIINSSDTLEVYISGKMDDEVCSNISNSIKAAAKAGIKQVVMHINSYGGSVAGAWDIIAAIKNSNLKLKAINEGFAISAASVLLASADEAKAFDYSTSMIHDPLANGVTLEKASGKTKELLIAIKDGIMNMLNNRLKLPIEELSDLLKKETSWNAKQQLEYGLVDEIISTKSKPNFTNDMDTLSIWNIIEDHNNLNINNLNINSMTQEEIDVLVEENKNLKAKIAELETEPVVEEVIEPVEPVIEPTEPVIKEVVEPIIVTEPVIEKDKKVVEPIANQLIIDLKTENFILKNSLTNKSSMIENAVKLHGVEVLDTIINFINNDSKALETKVVELQNIITNTVNVANDGIDSIINSGSVKDYETMAENIFGINGDSAARIEMKHDNPELHEKLFNIYYNIVE